MSGFLPGSVPGGMDRVRDSRPLLNAHPVPPGKHHDVPDPIPVTVTLHWETGIEQLDTVALEWLVRSDSVRRDAPTSLVRVRIVDPRVMTGAVWLPVEDVRRR